MINDTRSTQVSRIVQELAELPGGAALNIVSKKFPQFGPGATASGYEERTHSFSTDAVPATMVVPTDVEEIVIRLKGTLPHRQEKDNMVEKINTMLENHGLARQWETRASFASATPDTNHFEVTVFTNPAPDASA